MLLIIRSVVLWEITCISSVRLIDKLREECRLRVIENRILRRIVGPKKDENGDLRGLHIEELHNLYRSPKYSQGD